MATTTRFTINLFDGVFTHTHKHTSRYLSITDDDDDHGVYVCVKLDKIVNLSIC